MQIYKKKEYRFLSECALMCICYELYSTPRLKVVIQILRIVDINERLFCYAININRPFHKTFHICKLDFGKVL